MEFSNLGKNCSYCKMLDFLPFKCNLCNKFYCINHRTYFDHECDKYHEKQICDKINKIKIKKYKCYTCKKKTKFKIKCNICLKITCIKHRLNHKCIKITSTKNKHICSVCNKYSFNTLCKICNQIVCIEHRYKNTHKCIKDN